jgi:hypothetical protein
MIRREVRRGAPRPMHDLPPPAHLGAEAKIAFTEAAGSRPGIWTASDTRLMCAWAVLSVRARQLEVDPSLASDAKEYLRTTDALCRLGRALRLVPKPRGNEDGAIAPPLEGQPDGGARPWQVQ